MIQPDFVRTMAAYNAEMNRRLYDSAARLSDADRRAPRGAFWGGIHATLNHLLWGDRMWMSRLDNWEKPAISLRDSPALFDDFGALRFARAQADVALSGWAERLTPADLDGDLIWFSGATRRELVRPRALIIVHMFNHQTHHRGQVHAMLTQAGEQTGDTDLAFIL